MGEWDSAYTAITALAAGDDFLVRQLSATPPTPGTLRRIPAQALHQAIGGTRSSKMLGWFAGLAGRPYARASVVCIGDSITEGQGATDVDYRWPARLRDMLRARFPTLGLIPAGNAGGGRGFLTPKLTGSSSFSLPWVTVTGTPTSTTGYGPNFHTWDISAGGGCTLKYSLVGDSADILWVGASGNGTFSWSVDGGSATNVSTSQSTFTDGYITHVSLGIPGPHTLTITWVSGGSTYVDGVIEYNGDYSAGIQVHDGGYYGSTAAVWNSGSANQYPAAVAALSPNLVVIELGTNDAGGGASATTFSANLSAIVTLVRSGFTTPPPILLVAAYYSAAEGTSAATWAAYVAAMYAIAAADPSIDVLDLSLRMPAANAAVTWGAYAGDALHPSNLGHAMIADAVCQFLSPA